MKKYKGDIKSIIEVLAYILVVMSIGPIDNPIFSFVALGIWVVVLVYNLDSRIQNRNGNNNYILYPTKNDNYSKTNLLR